MDVVVVTDALLDTAGSTSVALAEGKEMVDESVTEPDGSLVTD